MCQLLPLLQSIVCWMSDNSSQLMNRGLSCLYIAVEPTVLLVCVDSDNIHCCCIIKRVRYNRIRECMCVVLLSAAAFRDVTVSTSSQR